MQYKTIIIILISILIILLFINHIKENYINIENIKICICMSYTKNIESYARLTEAINKKYAETNGYDLLTFHEEMTDRSPQWCKVEVVNKILDMNKYDYIFWIDADAFFNKHQDKLEDFILQDPEHDIIICDDIINSSKENTVNSGTFFVKCSEWSKGYFKMLWNYKGNLLYDYFHEQSVIEKTIENNTMDAKSRIIVNPSTYFNTVINVQLNDGSLENNFVIHLMGMSSEFRINYITNWIENHKELNINI